MIRNKFVVNRAIHRNSLFLLVISIGALGLASIYLIVSFLLRSSRVAMAATTVTGPATIAMSISPDNIDFGTVSSGSSSQTQTVTVASTSVSGYTITQNFSTSDSTDSSDRKENITAKWSKSGSIVKSGGTATIPLSLSHSFDSSSADIHNFVYEVSLQNVANLPAGSYTGTTHYDVTINIPSAPNNLSILPTSHLIGSSNNTLTITANAGLASAYSVYLSADNGTNKYTCDIDASSRTDTSLSCSLPKDLAAEAYQVYVITQASTDPYSAGTITYKTSASIDSTKCLNADNDSACQVDIDTNMIPVKYSGTSSSGKWVKADINKSGDWYNYNSKKWANAVTVSSNSLNQYKSAAAGTEISSSDVLGYWVYVPRYAYEVMRRDVNDTPVTAQNFSIRFETADTAKSTPVATCSTSSNHKDYRTGCSLDETYKAGSSTTTWATHPAFTWGNSELNGLWIAKFKATGSSTAITVMPDQTAASGLTVGQMFTAAHYIAVDDMAADAMGTSISDITSNSHNLSSAKAHMLKNSEWGAAAYLASSTYGAGVNNVASASTSSSGSYTTGGGNYAANGSQSTTGDQSGIYDMSTAGSYEYVMAPYTNDSSSTKQYYFLGGDSSRSYATAPYADIFSASTFSNEQYYKNSNKCTYELCGGQALYETRTVQSETSESSKISWGDSYSDFVSSRKYWYRWLGRGGGYSGDASGEGIFSTTAHTGEATRWSTFRPVIININ